MGKEAEEAANRGRELNKKMEEDVRRRDAKKGKGK